MKEEQVIHLMHKTMFMLEKMVNGVFEKKAEITFSQFRIMAAIKFNCEIFEKGSQQVIAEHLHISGPAVSRHVDELVKKGFVERKEDENNRRRHIITLTWSGEKMIAKTLPLLNNVASDVFQDVPDKNKEIIIKSLESVLIRMNYK